MKILNMINGSENKHLKHALRSYRAVICTDHFKNFSQELYEILPQEVVNMMHKLMADVRRKSAFPLIRQSLQMKT